MSAAQATTDHHAIREWVEEHGGRPARVKATAGKSSGILRIDFGEPEESLEEIPWNEFFNIFERRKLAFLHQDDTADGKESRFVKFVDRE